MNKTEAQAKIQEALNASGTVAPSTTFATILQILEQLSPIVAQELPVLFPNNPIVADLVALLIKFMPTA